MVANMAPRPEDPLGGSSEAVPSDWSDRDMYPSALTVELGPLELLGPTGEEWETQEEELLKEWVWKNHKQEIWKHLRVTVSNGTEKERIKPGCFNCRDLELYKKRWELTHRVARATQNFLQNEGSKVVYQCLLNGLLELEESEYGFIGEVHNRDTGEPYIQIHAATTSAIAKESAETKRFFAAYEGYKFTNMASLFGQICTSASPVISNNVAEDQTTSCPYKGHPDIHNFLGLPLYGKEREVIGVLCIGNKKGGYSMSDVSFLEPFTATGSNLIQAYGQLAENRRLIKDLENKVRERTQSLQESNEQLEQAHQLVVQTSKQQLQHFACMSHEIRTPLNCIIGLSSLLQGTDMSPLQKENMQMITASGNLLLNVVNDVLDFSKLATGNLEIDCKRSNLQEALDATVHAIDMKARTQYLTLRTVYDPQLPEYVNTDTHRLQQILFNLLGNAIK